jgi:hypothetical protein
MWVAQEEAMDRITSQALLAEAAMLMTATRVRIARTARLLGTVARSGTWVKGDAQASSRRPSPHPSSAPPP